MISIRVPRSLAFGALSVVALISLMTFRSVLEARSELALAERALAATDLNASVAHFRLAARWAAPFNIYAERALAGLEALAKAAELRGDTVLALSAYRGVHGALHAARGIEVREPERLLRADSRIAALMAREPPPEADAGLSQAQREAQYRALLQVQGPNQNGVLLACGGFFTWVSAFAMLVLRGLDNEGRIVKAVARPSFLFLVFGWVAFAVGLKIA